MRLQTFSQHKNLILSAVVALSIFLVALFSLHNEGASADERTLGASTLTYTQTATDIDTDHDLLSDWKEKLYGADINNPDTDGDGTIDGDEVRLGRNPTIPNTAGEENPNDRLSTLEDPHLTASSVHTSEDAKKEFFATYLAQGSQNIKETTFRDLIKTVDRAPLIPQKEIVNLNISSDNSAESTKTYVNAFGVVIEKYLSQHMDRSEDAVIEEAMTKKDPNTKTELQLYAVMYKNFAKDLIALPVPSALAKAHLLIVNGYEGMGNGLLGIGKMQSDPINGTASYQTYMKYRLDVVNGYAMIVTSIAHQHITFAPDEPGYPFYWNTTASNTPAAR